VGQEHRIDDEIDGDEEDDDGVDGTVAVQIP
jgi:hypothetical protein